MASARYNGSICLSDIPSEKITTSEKNGKKYLNVTIWVNETNDQYGNIGSISVNKTKDEIDAKTKTLYIGNFKLPEMKEQPSAPEEKLPWE